MRIPNYISAAEALSVLKSGDNVFIQTAAAAPQQLIFAMTEKGKSLQNVSIYHLHTEGVVPYSTEEMTKHFNVHCFLSGPICGPLYIKVLQIIFLFL